jgi:hypothetical protein
MTERASNVSGLTVELQHDRVQLAVDGMEGRVWEIRLSEGKQEVVPRAEQTGHSQGQIRWERQRVRPKERQPNPRPPLRPCDR